MTVLWEDKEIRKTAVETIQINLGNKCNQSCYHCHISASPAGDKNMNEETALRVLKKLIDFSPQLVEFTGGAPEMNHNLKMLIEELSKHKIKIAIRTNLTILDMPEYSEFISLYKEYGVKLIASLPGYSRDITDRQRGKGVFDKSIAVLKKLNHVGYGNKALELDLVHNPSDNCLKFSTDQLEHDYKQILKKEHGVIFNKLISITNSPIGGFKRYLIKSNKYEDYLKLLANNFNSDTLNHIMCKRLVSVDYLGYIYDCDFNLALGIKTRGYENKKFWEINFNDFNPEISCGEHCYACTAVNGSSCYGKLLDTKSQILNLCMIT
ncbi:radical SAM/Cys-rich domain protein [Dissulfurispira thermophila]|uniref:Radical SAM/Cys-rich domain protein n=1 Tax=Dissulfurispira thermophila TaxID=2715679 RepID=A0A7G1H156_9BACT|nr:arsenosugar biosynthesis radical SAM (seleno)protein ArsS [Dissulfurispira thermophila]BCB96550.1 radical SAM/Cys-rich domain protein [Dissulfurispira thermophila]